jgi:putative ABC transport system permease protein
MLAESLMLSIGGGLIGAGVVWLGLPALLGTTPRVLPRLDEVKFDDTVLTFTAILCVATGFVVGIAPAWRASRRGPLSGLPRSSRHRWVRWAGATLLVALLAAQVALTVVLLAGAGLAFRAFGDLQSRDVGVDPSGLLSFDVHLPRDPYVAPVVAQAGSLEMAEFSPDGPALYDRIRAALQTMPGVVQAAGVGAPPFTSSPFVQFWVGEQEHTPDSQVAAQYLAVTENYFNTMGIRILRGRDFSPADRTDSPWVILVNEAMARQHWPTSDPIGQQLSLTFHPNDGEPPREIVGLVADTLPFRGASEVPPLIFLLHRQQTARQRASLEGRRTVMSFVIRTAGDPLALGDAARSVVGKVDATTPVTSIRTVRSYLNAGQVMLLQFAATLLGIFALAALVSAAAGIYSLTSYGLTEHGTMLVPVLLDVVAVFAGAALGLVAWRRLGGVIEPFLTNLTVTPSDPFVLVAIGGVLFAALLVAGLGPALGARTAKH